LIESEVFRLYVPAARRCALLSRPTPWRCSCLFRPGRIALRAASLAGVSSKSKRLLIRDACPSKTGIDLSQGSSPDEPILAVMLFAERFKCRECGAWYVATWEHSLRRQPAPGTFNCKDCGTVVHSWSGIDRYSDWRLVKRAFSDWEKQ